MLVFFLLQNHDKFLGSSLIMSLLIRIFLLNRNYDKENLAKTTSNITKDLMSVARVMESQTKQSEQDLICLGEYNNNQ